MWQIMQEMPRNSSKFELKIFEQRTNIDPMRMLGHTHTHTYIQPHCEQLYRAHYTCQQVATLSALDFNVTN